MSAFNANKQKKLNGNTSRIKSFNKKITAGHLSIKRLSSSRSTDDKYACGRGACAAGQAEANIWVVSASAPFFFLSARAKANAE